MKGKRLAVMSLVLLLCLSACQSVDPQPSPAANTPQISSLPSLAPTPAPTPSPTPEPAPKPTPSTEYSFVNERSQERFTADGLTNWGTRSFVATYKDELGPYFSIHVDLPWAVAEGEGYAAIDKRFEDLMEEYKADIWEPYSPEDRQFLFSEPSLSVGFSTVELGRLITFRFLEYPYWGGAHGMGSTWVETYDMVTGKELGLADFFTDPAEAAARMKAEIRRQVEADPETYDWLFDARGQIISGLDEAFEPEQCYPVEGGFEVFYQWYTVAGHWAGAPTFFIDGDLLADLTRPLGTDQVLDLEPWGQRQVILNEYRDGQDILEYSASVPVARRAGPGYDAINNYYSDIDAFLEDAEEYLGRIDGFYDQLAFPYYEEYKMAPSFEAGGIVQVWGGSNYYLG